LGIPYDCSIVAPIILCYPKAIPTPPERHAPNVLKIIY